jgi:hypothetical protein
MRRTVALAALVSLAACTSAPRALGPEGRQDVARTSGRDPATLPPPIALSIDGPAVAGEAEPEIIDTRTFAEPIDRRPFRGEPRRPGSLLPKHETPRSDEPGPANSLVAGAARAVSRVDPGPAFPAIGQSPWSPPDPTLAVGPNHVVVTVNMEIAWYLKDGTPQFQQRLDSSGNPGFFEGIGSGAFTFDPKCFYDHHAGRFVVVALEQYSGTQESWITFAVSDDADPNGIWFKYRTWALVTDGDCQAWVDYPGFGFDANAWYVAANLFRFNVGSCAGFAGSLVRVMPKSGPMSGGTASWWDLRDGGGSWQVAQVRDGGSARIVRGGNQTQLQVGRINDPLGVPSLTKQMVAVPGVSSDSNAPTPSGSLAIVDSRVMNAAQRGERLFVARHGTGGSSANAGVVWNQIALASTPIAAQSGRIDGTGSEHLFFPAVAVNDLDQLGLVFGRSSVTLHPRVETSGRLPCDPPGTMAIGAVSVAGSVSPSGEGKRWGDYFDCTVDPVDGRTFWWIGEWQDANGWRTEVGSFRIGRRGDIDGNGSVNAIDIALFLGSFGGPGAGDLDRNGITDSADLALLLGDWGECVGGASGP